MFEDEGIGENLGLECKENLNILKSKTSDHPL